MTKIDIISGFLGAGKTTLIRKLIEEVFQGEKIVLIENEFGEIGIDGGFLKDSGIEINEMNAGCICCSLVGDFGRNLKEVLDRFKPDRILIEPSGVGKLSDVMKSVTELEQEQEVKLNGLLTVVNTLKATKQMRAFGEFFNNQIEYATTIILSRTQKASQEQMEKVVKDIRAKNQKAIIITTPWEEIQGKKLWQAVEYQKSLEEEILQKQEHSCCGHHHEEHHDHEGESCGCHGHHHEEHHDHEGESCGCHGHHHEEHHDHEGESCGCHGHHHEEHLDHEGESCGCHGHHHEHHHHEGHHHADEIFTSWGVETPHKFTKAVIEEAMKVFCDTEEYGMILRAKGMVPVEDKSWLYFDMVDGEYELREGEPDYTGRLCVIGTNLDNDKLTALFGL